MPYQERVHIDKLQPSRHQPRQEVGDVSDLVSSILEGGVFHSALVAKRRKDGELELLSGHRRLAAVREAAKQDRSQSQVPVLVYTEEELDPITEWKMMLDENSVRRNLKPVEEARAVIELKLRIDCDYLCSALDLDFSVRAKRLASFEDWQAEYAHLVGELTKQDKSADSYRSSWSEFEKYAGLKTTTRKRYGELAAAPATTQRYLLSTELPFMHQVAIVSAPAPVQLELARLVAEGRESTAALFAVQAAARTLFQHPDDWEVVRVLQAAVELFGQHPQATLGALTQMVAERLKADAGAAGCAPVISSEATSVPPAVIATQTGADEQGSAANTEVAQMVSEAIPKRAIIAQSQSAVADTSSPDQLATAEARQQLIADQTLIISLATVIDRYRRLGDAAQLYRDLEAWLDEQRRRTGPLPQAA